MGVTTLPEFEPHSVDTLRAWLDESKTVAVDYPDESREILLQALESKDALVLARRTFPA
jgi:hypothetical protein